MRRHGQRLRAHFSPADKAGGDYAYVPFQLTQPASRLHVRYSYSHPISSDRQEGGNVIDLGLFDPRGSSFPGGWGFRGWSGSARREFTISRQEATPGYVPGPLPAGRYQIILGLYRIWEQGADVEIWCEADLDDGPDRPWEDMPRSEELPPRLPAGANGMRWLRGDLQCHTVHSDATGTPQQLVAKARALGLDFLAVTDHNTVSHHPFLPPLADEHLILIPGQETTTYYGHMNIWGTKRWCDFRCRSDPEMAAVIDLAHRHGALCSINHPKEGGPAWEYGSDLPVDAMEVWQGPWPHRNRESVALWDRLLASGRRLPAVGGSDYHCPSGEDTNLLRLGQPTTWVQVDRPTSDGVLAAIAAGRACISATPDGPRLEVKASTATGQAQMGEILCPAAGEERVHVHAFVTGGAGHMLRLQMDGHIAHEAPVIESPALVAVDLPVRTYVRAELVGDMAPEQLPAGVPADLDLQDWRWALSNPVYVRWRRPWALTSK